jgi:transposase-like protein
LNEKNLYCPESPEGGLDPSVCELERGYPPIAKSWQRNRDGFIRLFDYPTEIRRIIYITNAIA